MSAVHVLVPDSVDDPSHPSGGNTYDRRLCDGLADNGWMVLEYAVAGGWPIPSRSDRDALARTLAGIPDGAVVLVDGLIGSAVPEVIVPAADRLRLAVLVHLPLGVETAAARAGERAALAAAAGVVVTSGWTRGWLVEHYGLEPGRIVLAEPGVDEAELVTGTDAGAQLLCVAAVTTTKGHDVLVAALAAVADLDWRCVCVGDLERDPALTGAIGPALVARGIADRVRIAGPRVGDELAAAYAAADLLVLPSRQETYGMVVTEALARGLPVLATRVGGLPETLGRTGGGDRPGLLVPPQDASALAAALRRWLLEPGLRQRLRANARKRRKELGSWSETSRTIAGALAGMVGVAR